MVSPNDDHVPTYIPDMYAGYVPLQPAYAQHMSYGQYPHPVEHQMQSLPLIPQYHEHLGPSHFLPSSFSEQNSIVSNPYDPELQTTSLVSASASASTSPTYNPSSPKPFTCTEQSCTSTNRSFRRKGDLERHMNTVHRKDALQMHDCWLPGCQRKSTEPRGGFSRKDHLIEHVRYVHHIDIPKNRRAAWRTNARRRDVHDCPVQDCKRAAMGDEGGFKTQELLFEHMKDIHNFPSWLFPSQQSVKASSTPQIPDGTELGNHSLETLDSMGARFTSKPR